MSEKLNHSHSEKSIAVLPFVNMSADPENEYFSDGITEEIINALVKVRGLRVTARTSSFAFKGKNLDVRSIGKRLNVASILEGSVRKEKDRVRITAQLIRTYDGFHLWSEKFDRKLKEIFAVQDEISLLIADQVRENFGHFDLQDHLVDQLTGNVDAYNLYLQGRYQQLKWDARGFSKAIEFYDRSIEQDPTFALPYFGAGLCHLFLGAWFTASRGESLKKAKDYLDIGKQKNANLPSGHHVFAKFSLWGEWNLPDAHQHFTRALALNPSFPESIEGIAEIHTALGQFEEALSLTSTILTLNPLSPNHYYTRGNIHYLKREYQKAIQCMDSALQLDPDFAIAVQVKTACYILMKDAEALESHFANNPLAEHPQACRLLFDLMYQTGNTDVNLEKAPSIYDSAMEEIKVFSFLPWHLYLQIYSGKTDIALDTLEDSIRNQVGQLINFLNDPFLEPLKETERYKQLAKSTFSSPGFSSKSWPEEATSSPKMSEKEVSEALSILENLIKNEKPFLDPALSLKTLAAKTGIHPNKLSWLLNEHLSRNFNEFINLHRLETFKVISKDPAYSHLSLLGLAYESGFTSKTVFNTYFKKVTGMSPGTWLKAVKE